MTNMIYHHDHSTGFLNYTSVLSNGVSILLGLPNAQLTKPLQIINIYFISCQNKDSKEL